MPPQSFAAFQNDCPSVPGPLGVTFICNMLRSCDILTMLWQHDENVMLERSVSAVGLESFSFSFFFLYMCETVSSQHNRGPPCFMGYLCSGGPFVIYGPNHYNSFTTLLTLTAIWSLETDFELCFYGNQTRFLRTEALII